MKIDPEDFRLHPGADIDLADRPTRTAAAYDSQTAYRELLDHDAKRLRRLQKRLQASAGDAVLVIFQGMDAAGKDGAIRHVLGGLNPMGCKAVDFKQPTPNDLRHDFLWRAAVALPGRGQIGIFNRSYYEDVLIMRVHPERLEEEGFGCGEGDRDAFWRHRYESILDFEKHLHRNAVRMVKIFLHISKDEQRARFLSRIDDPAKSWKLEASDIHERGYWSGYMAAYAACLRATGTGHAPWYVVPADDKRMARLIVARILVERFDALDIRERAPTADRRAALDAMRAQLIKD